MATIKAFREHELSTTEARTTVERLARRYQKQFGGAYYWNQNVLHFEGRGVEGQIAVREEDVHVTLQLGMLLWPMKGQVESAVKQHLNEHFA